MATFKLLGAGAGAGMIDFTKQAVATMGKDEATLLAMEFMKKAVATMGKDEARAAAVEFMTSAVPTTFGAWSATMKFVTGVIAAVEASSEMEASAAVKFVTGVMEESALLQVMSAPAVQVISAAAVEFMTSAVPTTFGFEAWSATMKFIERVIEVVEASSEMEASAAVKFVTGVMEEAAAVQAMSAALEAAAPSVQALEAAVQALVSPSVQAFEAAAVKAAAVKAAAVKAAAVQAAAVKAAAGKAAAVQAAAGKAAAFKSVVDEMRVIDEMRDFGVYQSMGKLGISLKDSMIVAMTVTKDNYEDTVTETYIMDSKVEYTFHRCSNAENVARATFSTPPMDSKELKELYKIWSSSVSRF